MLSRANIEQQVHPVTNYIIHQQTLYAQLLAGCASSGWQTLRHSLRDPNVAAATTTSATTILTEECTSQYTHVTHDVQQGALGAIHRTTMPSKT